MAGLADRIKEFTGLSKQVFQVFQDIINFLKYFFEKFNSNLSKTMFELPNKMWDNSLVSSFVRMATSIAVLLVFVAMIMVMFDIIEERSAGKPIDWGAVAGSFLKGIGFAFVAAPACAYLMVFITGLAGNLYDAIFMVGSDNTISNISIVLNIGLAIYTFKACTSSLAMFIQALTVPLYVPEIVRGNTEGLGSWLRQTIAIALTFLLQYLVFLLGLYFVHQVSVIMGVVIWFSGGVVEKVLGKWGMASGVKGSVAAAGRVVGATARVIASML